MKYRQEGSETGVKCKGLVVMVNANAQFGVFPNAFLKEVCFALKADYLHPFKQVSTFEVTVASKVQEESVSTEFDVVHIMAEFIPISLTGRVSTTNSILIATALLMILIIRDSRSQLISFKYKRHAKSQWSPLSWLISSLLKHRPGIRPRFSQPEDST